MMSPLRICRHFLALVVTGITALAGAPAGPENQVFQWSVSGESAPWPDGSKARGTLYLWVPEHCARLRGLVIMGTNVPEHGLVNHPAIRQVCAENDLGIAWSVPTFWRFGKVAPQPGAPPVDVKALPGSDRLQVEFLERLLADLAVKTGYAECATVPWLPVGESGHLLMVMGLVNERPARCLAGICVKNPQPPKDRTVPMLWTLGTGQEWGQTKSDPRDLWTKVDSYAGWVQQRAGTDWPLSILIEPGTGHFYCSDAMTGYFARYTDVVAKARLSRDGSPALAPVPLAQGVLADLPLPGRTDLTPIPWPEANAAARARPWFFNADLARAAQQFAAVNWSAAPQLVGFVPGANTTVAPFSFNSVTEVTVTTDGEFSVGATLLPEIPAGFVAAGTPLSRAAGEPVVEWLCGPFAPLGGGRFRLALDRTWKTGAASYLIARHEGDAQTRRTVQPARVTLKENLAGAPQAITFAPLPDVPAGTTAVPLRAHSDAGLPVQFFVRAGPAVVVGDQLVFTAIPPSARYPVAVTVVAWQWGRPAAPAVRTAPLVEQTFFLTSPR
jgi:hypothetical protein